MATKRKSTTTYPSPFANVPPTGKHVAFDRLTHDWSEFYNGNFLGCRKYRADAEALTNAAALVEAAEPEETTR